MKIILSVVVGLLFIATPAMAQDAIIAFGCIERSHAETLAGEMTESNVMAADPRWLTCRPIGAAVGSMADAPTPFLVLTDWEGDKFALYEDAMPDGSPVYFIAYWLNGYSPDGDGI